MSRSNDNVELWNAIVHDCGYEVLFTDEGLTVYDDEGCVVACGDDFDGVVADMEEHLAEFFEVIPKYVYSGLPEEGLLA